MSEQKLPRVLVLFSQKTDSNIFQDCIDANEPLKTKMAEFQKVTLDYDKFQSGTKKDRFSFVLAFNPSEDSNDLVEMQEEFFAHYSTAPVFVYLGRSDSEETIKTQVKNVHFIECDESAPQDKIIAALNWAVDKIAKVTKDEIEPAFHKVDTDKSGAIDKSELATLSSNLGQPLNEEQLSQAMKDLDLNGDGSIDLSEFTSWYLSGMAPLNGSKRAFKLMRNRGKSLVDAMKEQSQKAVLGQELKLKKHRFAVGFNNPEVAGTSVKAEIYPLGIHHEKLAERLVNLYDDCVKPDQGDDLVRIYMEGQIKMQAGKAQEHATKLQAIIDPILEMLQDEGLKVKIKVTANGDYVAIGTGAEKDDRKLSQISVPQDVQDVFHYTDHVISSEVRLGASLQDIMNGDDSLLSHLMKGFQVQASIQIISNIKHAILELLKVTDDEKLQMLSGPMMMLAPVFMLQIDANVNVQFDDFDEVKEHPLAGPFLASFSQLSEGALGDKEELMKLPTFAADGDLNKREKGMKAVCDIIAALDALIKDMDDEVAFNFSCPKVGASVHAEVKSAGMSDALKLAMMANPLMMELKGNLE